VYVIDEQDRIVSLSDNWLSFAMENQAGESCHPDRVINESIWTFIDGREATHLYQIFLAHVRLSQKPVILPFRCDAPDRRRYLELKISALPRKHVEFASRITREEPREDVGLLHCDVPRSDEIITMCSMCKKVKTFEHGWLDVEAAIVSLRLFERTVLPKISHGICPDCLVISMDEIERLKKEKALPANGMKGAHADFKP
jgi:hypothetical protein